LSDIYIRNIINDADEGDDSIKLINLPGGLKVKRICFSPGFESRDCDQLHFGYILNGSSRVVSKETNQSKILSKGDFIYVPANHDCFVEGDQPCEILFLQNFYERLDFGDLDILSKNAINEPDQIRNLSNGTLNYVRFTDSISACYGVFKPGWIWSKDVKPVVGTELCTHNHYGYVISGRLGVIYEGKEYTCNPGDFYCVPPNHDAYVKGNEEFVCLDFTSTIISYGVKNK